MMWFWKKKKEKRIVPEVKPVSLERLIEACEIYLSSEKSLDDYDMRQITLSLYTLALELKRLRDDVNTIAGIRVKINDHG